MYMRICGRMSLLASILWLSGCAVFSQGYSKPEIHLANLEMLQSNLWEQSFRLRLRVDNPNDRNLPVRGMHYRVYLNDSKLATGVTNQPFDVPAYGSEYFELDVRSNLWRHLGDLIKLVERQQPVSYRIEGHISTGMFWSPKLTLQEHGTLDPSDMRF